MYNNNKNSVPHIKSVLCFMVFMFQIKQHVINTLNFKFFILFAYHNLRWIIVVCSTLLYYCL